MKDQALPFVSGVLLCLSAPSCPFVRRNGATPNIYPGQYSTDVIADKAVAQIKSAVASGQPFYAQISPIAPHTSTQIWVDPVTNV